MAKGKRRGDCPIVIVECSPLLEAIMMAIEKSIRGAIGPIWFNFMKKWNKTTLI